MLSNIFDFLEKIKAGITKPDARITMEVHDMGNGDGLKFQFLWYEDKLLKVSHFIPQEVITSFDDAFLADHIIRTVNLEIDKYILKEKE